MNDAWLRHSALALAVSGLLHAPAASAQDIPVEAEFDRQMLISRGLAPELADLFRKAPQFTPGSHRVALQVNGRGRGSVDAQFSTSGELRATLALLRDARLHTPRSVADLGEDATFDLRQAWPQAVVRPQPGQQALHLVLPVEALDDANGTPDDWHQGGSAALLNYDVSSNTRVAAGRSQTSYTAFTEVGVNTGGWILRSRQSFSHSGSASHLQVVESFAQRSLVHRRQLLQIGELAVAGPLFGGALITGIQLLPEDALPAPEAGGVVVEGLANSEARVEVRQSGVLIHSTLVPPGPFALSAISPRSATADLEVTVHEQDGERRFQVPATSFNHARLARPGATLAAGQLRRFDSVRGGSRSLLTTSNAWRLPAADAVLSGGALLSERYQAVSLGLDHVLHGNSRAIISGRTTFARAAHGYGLSMDLRLGTQWGPLRLNLGGSRRTRGYRDLYELDPGEPSATLQGRVKWQGAAGLAGATQRWGSFSAHWAPLATFDGRRGSRMTGSWSQRIGRSTLSATLESVSGRLQPGARRDRAAYLSLSVPLNGASLRANMRQRNGRNTMALDASGRATPQLNWRASAQQHGGRQTTRQFSAGTGLLLPRARVAASMTLGESSRTLNTQLSGGMVLHPQGLTFSPTRVQDTFGIATVGSIKGVRLSTGGGSAWTDRKGRAVLPNLRAYADTRVNIEGSSLPRRADVQNGTRTLRAARGSVSYVSFKVELNQRAFLAATYGDGSPVPKGLTVLADGQFLTATVEGGRIYLPSYQPQQRLQLVLGGGRRCELEVDLPEQVAEDAFFQEGTARCST